MASRSSRAPCSGARGSFVPFPQPDLQSHALRRGAVLHAPAAEVRLTGAVPAGIDANGGRSATRIRTAGRNIVASHRGRSHRAAHMSGTRDKALVRRTRLLCIAVVHLKGAGNLRFADRRPLHRSFDSLQERRHLAGSGGRALRKDKNGKKREGKERQEDRFTPHHLSFLVGLKDHSARVTPLIDEY